MSFMVMVYYSETILIKIGKEKSYVGKVQKKLNF